MLAGLVVHSRPSHSLCTTTQVPPPPLLHQHDGGRVGLGMHQGKKEAETRGREERKDDGEEGREGDACCC